MQQEKLDGVRQQQQHYGRFWDGLVAAGQLRRLGENIRPGKLYRFSPWRKQDAQQHAVPVLLQTRKQLFTETLSVHLSILIVSNASAIPKPENSAPDLLAEAKSDHGPRCEPLAIVTH